MKSFAQMFFCRPFESLFFNKTPHFFMIHNFTNVTKRWHCRPFLPVFRRRVFLFLVNIYSPVMKLVSLLEPKLQSLSLGYCVSNVYPDFHQNHIWGMNGITCVLLISQQICCLSLNALLVKICAFDFIFVIKFKKTLV